MKKLLPIFLVLFTVVQAWARQEMIASDSLTADTIEVVEHKVRAVGFWLAVYGEPAYVKAADGINTGLGAVVIWREKFYLGGYGVAFTGEYDRRLIFPNEFRMKYSHAGVWLGYKTAPERPYQLTAEMRVGEGKIFWERLDNFYNVFEDYALFVQPAVGVDVKLIKYAAVHADLGYRLVRGVDLPGMSDDGLSGLAVNLMLKVGLF